MSGDLLRCLTIREPWCSLILRGQKTVEIRSRRALYRGWLVLTCSKSSDGPLAGTAFALVYLRDCVPGRDVSPASAGCDVAPHAWGWVLDTLIPFSPRAVSGKLGLWTPDDSLVRVARAARRNHAAHSASGVSCGKLAPRKGH